MPVGEEWLIKCNRFPASSLFFWIWKRSAWTLAKSNSGRKRSVRRSCSSYRFNAGSWSTVVRSLILLWPVECPCNGRGDLVLLLEYVGLLVCLACPCKFWKASRSSPKVEVGVRARTPTNILCLLLRRPWPCKNFSTRRQKPKNTSRILWVFDLV